MTSPSGRFRLEVTEGDHETTGVVTRVEGGAPVCTIVRNHSMFHHSWVTRAGEEWLITGRSYVMQTIVNCDTGKLFEQGDPDDGTGFIWTEARLSPDERTLAVDGCVWACPWEIRFFDFSDPTRGWPELEGSGDLDVDGEGAWHPDGSFEHRLVRDRIVVLRTRVERRGDRMVIVERADPRRAPPRW